MTRAAVFDIDGTLTNTFDVDIECYERAVREVLGVRVPADWHEWDEVTDSAILHRACRVRGHPAPDPATEAHIAGRLADLLEGALARSPERFGPVPGAREVFGVLRAAGWRVAMATGAWRPSAELKLDAAGIPRASVPLATSSDRSARREILGLALESVDGDPSRSVYFGDGVWDGRAAAAVGCAFIGVGGPAREAALSQTGARAVIRDFKDADALVRVLLELER